MIASLIRRYGPFGLALIVTMGATLLSAALTTITVIIMGLELIPGLPLAVITPFVLALPTTYLAFHAVDRADRAHQHQLRSEGELHAAEARLRDAIDNMPNMVMLFDAHDRLIVKNKQYNRAYPDLSDSVMAGISFEDMVRVVESKGYFVSLGSKEEAIQKRLALHAEKSGSLEVRTSSGRWMLINEAPTSEGGSIVVNTDITELKIREEALVKSEARLRGFLDLASDWTLEFDEELRFKQAEDAVAQRLQETTGLNFNRGVGLTRWELAGVENPESDPQWAAHYADLMARREFRDFRYSFVDSKSRTRHLRVSGRPQFDEVGNFTGYFSVGTDETEQVTARLRAEESQNQLLDAVDSIPGPTLILDSENRVELFNKAWREWYPELERVISPGTAFEDVARLISDTGLWDPMGPRDEVRQDRLQRQREPASSFEQELSDGRFILVNESRTRNGGRIIVHTDITEIKQLDRMKDELISMVSHELRTPLTSIKGSIDLMDAGVIGDQGPEAKKLINIAKRNTDRLLVIVNDILDIHKIQSGTIEYRMETLKLVPLVKGAVAANEAMGRGYGITFNVVESVENAMVHIDAQRFEQILTNLLSNAAKFSPRGNAVDVSVNRRNSCLCVSVSDSGPGIPLAFRDRIFQRFWQGDSTDSRGVSGTGLGLSISKNLVDAMGGNIWFESRPDGGCTFHIEFPQST